MESLILAQSERWRRGLGMQVERSLLLMGIETFGLMFPDATLDSGKRVRNAWVTCLEKEDSLPKGEIILHNPLTSKMSRAKMASIYKLSCQEGPASYQVVGRVKAYQA